MSEDLGKKRGKKMTARGSEAPETGQVAGHSGLTENGKEPIAFRAEQEVCRGMIRTHTNRNKKKILLDYLQLEFLTSFLGPSFPCHRP